MQSVEATVVSALSEGLTTVTGALSAKERKPSPGLEGVNVLTGDPRFAAGVPPVPLSPDAAYTVLVLPTPGDMTLMMDWTGTEETRSAPLSTDTGVGTD